MINTIVTLAAPMDKPVLMLDSYTQTFYKSIDKYWLENRETVRTVNNETNSCRRPKVINEKDIVANEGAEVPSETRNDDYFLLNNKLLVTIGGGSRDLQVHSALTTSKFSDVHAIVSDNHLIFQMNVIFLFTSRVQKYQMFGCPLIICALFGVCNWFNL
jgi:hypothetical protein